MNDDAPTRLRDEPEFLALSGLRFEDEAAWVQRTAEASGWPHGIVAYADFTVPDVRPQLERLARLRELGVLSDEEFERAKKKLIAPS